MLPTCSTFGKPLVESFQSFCLFVLFYTLSHTRQALITLPSSSLEPQATSLDAAPGQPLPLASSPSPFKPQALFSTAAPGPRTPQTPPFEPQAFFTLAAPGQLPPQASSPLPHPKPQANLLTSAPGPRQLQDHARTITLGTPKTENRSTSLHSPSGGFHRIARVQISGRASGFDFVRPHRVTALIVFCQIFGELHCKVFQPLWWLSLSSI